MKKRRINRGISDHANLDHDTFVQLLREWWGITLWVSIRVYEEPFMVLSQEGCSGCEHCGGVGLVHTQESLLDKTWTVWRLPDPDVMPEDRFPALWAGARADRDKVVQEILAFEVEASRLYAESPDR